MMVAWIKGEFLLMDYSLIMFRSLQNLRHKEINVTKYIEEFYWLSSISRQTNEGDDVVGRHKNGLWYVI
jgi:hypothetical protein